MNRFSRRLPLAEEATSPCGIIDRWGHPTRTSRLMDPSAKPTLPRSGATLPEAAKGRSRVQHGYRANTSCQKTPYTTYKRHFNESLLTSKCPPINRKGQRMGSTVSSRRPAPPSRLDQMPVGANPPFDHGERLGKGSPKIGELVKGRSVCPFGI